MDFQDGSFGDECDLNHSSEMATPMPSKSWKLALALGQDVLWTVWK